MADKKMLYDYDELRAIPILEVCDFLGLDVEKRGKNFWCKVRPENKASVILHTDTNHFYDFGTCEHGNNIDLVQYAQGISPGKAIHKLAKAFGIRRNVSSKERLSRPMTPWEYKKIGLHSDLATKNIAFPVTTASIEELLEIEHAYRMPMNDLRKQEPEMYRQILETKAIPYVQHKRELYYLSVWKHYSFLQMMGREVLFFDSERTAARFEPDMKSLAQSERALLKACQGTGISIQEQTPLDPQRVFSHIMLGRISISVGPMTKEEMEAHAEETKTPLYQATMSCPEYRGLDTDNHPHCALLYKGQILITFPEQEKPFFDRFCSPDKQQKKKLDILLSDAEDRHQPQQQPLNRIPEPVR